MFFVSKLYVDVYTLYNYYDYSCMMRQMKIHVRKWGNSIGVRIPQILAKKIGIIDGEEVDIDVVDNRIVVSKPMQELDDLLEQVTTENTHGAVDTGSQKGNEIW